MRICLKMYWCEIIRRHMHRTGECLHMKSAHAVDLSLVMMMSPGPLNLFRLRISWRIGWLKALLGLMSQSAQNIGHLKIN